MRTLAARGLLPPDQADQPEELPTPEPTDTFSIVLIPDTQRLAASSSWIAHFQAAANWIAINKEARNIELVLHLGDVVNDGNTTQFDRAEMPMATIWDTGIPFGACIGNHDYDGGSPAADRSNTTMWNSYFGIDQYTGRPWWDGDFMTAGASENYYFRTSLGGRPTVVLSLEFFPATATLSWAAGVIEANPTHDVIIITHAYLNYDGTLSQDGTQWGPDTYAMTDKNSGVDMWAVFKQYPNLVAVFNGHFLGARTATLIGTGDEGNDVFQQFTNWQEQDEGGDGRLVVIEVDPITGAAVREVYNAAHDVFESAYTFNFQLYQT